MKQDENKQSSDTVNTGHTRNRMKTNNAQIITQTTEKMSNMSTIKLNIFYFLKISKKLDCEQVMKTIIKSPLPSQSNKGVNPGALEG